MFPGQHHQPRHTLPRVAYRLVSGRALDGVARTDSSYLRPATRALTPSGRASRWAMLPGWKRQAARLGVPAAGYATHAAWSVAPVYTTTAAAVLAGVGAVRGARSARRAWRTRRFRAVYIRPVLAALAPALGNASVRLHVDAELGSLMPRLARPMSPAETAAREWYGEHVEPVLRWAPDRVMRAAWALQKAAKPLTRHLEHLRVPGGEATGPYIRLLFGTPYLTVEQRQHVSAVIGAKIPAGDLNEKWDQVGEQVSVMWTVRKRPPSRVGYADLQARLDQLAEDEYFIGLGVGGKPVTISLSDDSPHIAVSAGSGAGKSVLAQLIAVQVLARGGQVLILDRKGSHRALVGLPGVTYCLAVPDMHAAVIGAASLADTRNTRAFTEPEGWDPGPRVLIICEELNATIGALRDYWAEVRESSEPTTSPAVKAIGEILFMGRSARVNMIGIAQLLTARAIGGPEARENFGIRCLARYTTNAWRMLVPEASMPRSSRTLGRWQVVVGGVATEVQVAYLAPHEARRLVYAVSPGAQASLIGADRPKSPGQASSGDIPADPLSELLTLRQAVERGIGPWAYDATKKRLQRSRRAGSATVPEVAGKDGLADQFRLGDLIAWVEAELVS